MTSKIFRSTVLVAVIVLLCSLGVVMGVLYNHFTGVQVQQLKNELSLAVTGTEQYGNAFLENVEADRFRALLKFLAMVLIMQSRRLRLPTRKCSRRCMENS